MFLVGDVIYFVVALQLPGVARRQVTFFCFAKKKVTQEKATPVCCPCGVPCVAQLVRLPHKLARSATRPRAQTYSSEFSDQFPLLGGAQGESKSKSRTMAWALRAHAIAQNLIFASAHRSSGVSNIFDRATLFNLRSSSRVITASFQ